MFYKNKNYMKPIQFAKPFMAIVLICLTFIACKKDSYTTAPPTLLKSWNVILNAKFENPAPAGRTETGTASLELYSDSTLKYTVTVTGLASGDVLNAAHIHVGNAITNGAVVLGFNPTFVNGVATATISLRKSLADSIINATTDFYVNVHSTQVGSGLIRGQIDNPVTFATDVAMSGSQEVPAVTTTATGVALLRLTADKTLYGRVTISNLEAGDALTAAHIHTGATGTNGSVIVGLISGSTDFGLPLKITGISDANIALIQTGQVYVNAHSTRYGDGIVRGQIR